jgi:hypothetical protein
MHRWAWLASAMVLAAGCNSDGGGGGTPSGPVFTRCPVARVVQNASDLVPGPLARGTGGDLVIENDKLRAIIQKGGRNWFNIAEFGGSIIDALPRGADGNLVGRDHFEDFVLGTNIESAPNYQTVQVIEAGGENPDGTCKAAVVRATGPDDLMDFVNGSSAIRQLSLQGAPLNFPPSADDVDLPVTIQTDYTLEQGKSYVRIDTKLINTSSNELDIYLVEYMNGSGEVELFQHGYGFGEAFATAPCDATRCNFVAYAGHEGGTGVSYGLIHKEAGSTSVSVSGVTVFLYGRDIVLVATTPEATQRDNPNASPNYTIPANGERIITRYFAVGTGTVASIVDVRNEIHGLTTGTVEGLVTDPSGPVAGAEIAMISSGRDGFPQGRGPTTNVVNHFRTDTAGRYRGTFPPGGYTLHLNMPGRLAGTPSTANITITASQTVTQNFTLPPPSYLRVFVRENSPTGRRIPAKVQLVGDPLGPDGNEPRNQDQLFAGNPLGIFTGFFGDPFADPLPPKIALAEFAVHDTGSGAVEVGDTGLMVIEPGTYQLSVSRGPRYSEFTQNVTITQGKTTEVDAVLTEIIPVPNHVFGDFHVHSFDSPDSEVTNRERVATYVSEDMDFFAASDHDMRVDFSPVITDMSLGAWVATTPSAEVTTFDYGHFNFWPVAIETNSPNSELPNEGHSDDAKIGRGATDWGGMAPLGKDFPSAGYYVLTPQEIFDSAAQDPLQPGRQVVRQINHIDSHFGSVGLRIDTGRANGPPRSSATAASKRLNPSYDNPAFDIAAEEPNFYGDNYDALEVWIGTDGRSGQTSVFIDQNLGDWINLLNQGRRRSGMSSSDTHERRITSLFTRNMISVPAGLLDAQGRPHPPAIAGDPHTVGDSVRAGYTTMTGGPIVTVKARNAANATAGLELSDRFGVITKPLPLAAPDEEVTLTIDVKSAPWAAYDQVLVFVNGHTVRHTNSTTGQPTTPPRYKLCAPAYRFDLPSGFTRSSVPVAGATRYETSKSVPIASPGADYWIVVMVRGTQGKSAPMWPVVPNSFNNVDGNLLTRSASDTGVMALTVTNPIFVDADNNGTWEAPGVLTHQGTTLPPDQCPGGAMPAP